MAKEAIQRRLEKYRRYNAKRANDAEYVSRRRERDKNRYERIKDTPEYRKRQTETSHRMRHLYPEKEAARRQVRSAIASGSLTRLSCEVCGAPEVEAHHDDYSRPLDVRWLCRVHHREHHARATSAEGV